MLQRTWYVLAGSPSIFYGLLTVAVRRLMVSAGTSRTTNWSTPSTNSSCEISPGGPLISQQLSQENTTMFFFFRKLSMKYWLFHRDPTKMGWSLITIPIWLGSISSPIYSLTNQGPFFRCSTRISMARPHKKGQWTSSTKLKNLKNLYTHPKNTTGWHQRNWGPSWKRRFRTWKPIILFVIFLALPLSFGTVQPFSESEIKSY